jgi:hypothetical protein
MVAQDRQPSYSQGVGGEKQGGNEVKNMESQTLFIIGCSIPGIIALLIEILKWLRYKFAHPKLEIQYQQVEGELADIAVPNRTSSDDIEYIRKKAIFYHLKVKNEKASCMVKNCRVYLDSIVYKKDNKDRKINARYSFCWTPSETTNAGVDFWQEHIFDIGFLVENEGYFRLGLRANYNPVYNPNYNPIYNNIQAQERYRINKNEPIILSLRVTADNFPYHTQQFEINWDGEWPEVPEKNHLTIKKV